MSGRVRQHRPHSDEKLQQNSRVPRPRRDTESSLISVGLEHVIYASRGGPRSKRDRIEPLSLPLRRRGAVAAGTDLFGALTVHHHDIKLSFANAHLHFGDIGGCCERSWFSRVVDR
jgi:hypothetical protein